MDDFKPFPKIPRWSSTHIVVTEKIDGTNAQIVVSEDCQSFRCGSRNRWVSVGDDNYGFASFCENNREAVLSLGKGQHFGEWWGNGIQRGYGLTEKRFSLFNTYRWNTPEQQDRLSKTPFSVVPVLYEGPFSTDAIETCLESIHTEGSVAMPGYMNPEGIIIYIPGSRSLFKKTFDNNHKGQET